MTSHLFAGAVGGVVIPLATTETCRQVHIMQELATVRYHLMILGAAIAPQSRITTLDREAEFPLHGDLGTGLPCSNCKGAGVDSCQFLRVSSTEAQMKNDPFDFNGFEPPSAPPRLQCRIVPYGATASYMPPAPASADGFYSRNNPISSYQYPPTRYYGVPPYSEFADENVDYGLQGGSFSLLGSDQLLSSSFPSTSSRGWAAPPLVSRSGPVSPVYLEQEAAYNHGQVSYHNNGYPVRPTISPEARNSSICGQAVNSSLPTPVSGTDRVLPIPASNRPTHMNSYLRGANGLPAASQAGYQPYEGLINTSNLNTAKNINSSAIVDNSSSSASYLPYSSTSPESLASQPAYSSQSTPQQQNDLFTANNEGLFQASESSELSYGPSSSDKRGSVSSQNNTTSDRPLQTLSNNNLANGHAYIPYHHQPSYPAPPAATSTSSLPVPPRRVSPSISAT
ncbi:uncharacterized protein BP5553_03316 [Venustampulla echinocandica]|uniref:Zn(2)-C6 fungal-type domain-containing protein n=1 Tax=Venustampulla echinocandica TaxID=2656787 RepID=A0A370TTX0_9HELO|nr:uncharacterized protein BP5553_03316 [Venustampulla echinocandica]RDL38976.1 hypothetical protein BP5553_03316 [Venustampulla echinocandica]